MSRPYMPSPRAGRYDHFIIVLIQVAAVVAAFLLIFVRGTV